MPWHYFREAHLFDLVHGTDTHARVTLDRFEETPKTFEHGVLYMCSWTTEVARSFAFVRQLLGHQFTCHAFVDIGCGKGKVPLIWSLECKKQGIRQKIIGIDYIGSFISTAKCNATRLGIDGIDFVQSDAAAFDYDAIGAALIVYLYNPFNGVLLEQVLGRLRGLNTVLIYNNPVYPEVPIAAGWQRAHERRSFHPNQHTIVYRRAADGAALNSPPPERAR